MTPDIKQLQYLHDAIVAEINWCVRDHGRRDVSLILHADEDCGVKQWSGQTVVLTFCDCFLFISTLLGHTLDPETLSTIRMGSTETTAGYLKRLKDCGISEPALSLIISFGSGAEIAVVCEDISISVSLGT